MAARHPFSRCSLRTVSLDPFSCWKIAARLLLCCLSETRSAELHCCRFLHVLTSCLARCVAPAPAGFSLDAQGGQLGADSKAMAQSACSGFVLTNRCLPRFAQWEEVRRVFGPSGRPMVSLLCLIRASDCLIDSHRRPLKFVIRTNRYIMARARKIRSVQRSSTLIRAFSSRFAHLLTLPRFLIAF